MENVEIKAFDILDSIKGAKTVEAVHDILRDTTRDFGFDVFLMTGVPLPGETLDEHVVVSGWAEEWLERYGSKNYVHVDPIANQIRRTTNPFRWSDIVYDHKREKAGHTVMCEAQDFKMRDGFCVPIYTLGGYQAVVTMGGENYDLSQRDEAAIQLISLFAHSKTTELRMEHNNVPSKEIPHLTRRETEVLKWTSQGKTAWEIGQILSIAEGTVHLHIRSINRKFETSNKVHSVAEAMRVGLIF